MRNAPLPVALDDPSWSIMTESRDATLASNLCISGYHAKQAGTRKRAEQRN
jgi:hypothetical protein